MPGYQNAVFVWKYLCFSLKKKLGVLNEFAYYRSFTHSWSWALLEKPPIVQLLKNFPAFYGTRKFITVLQEPSIGPYPKPDQPNPYHPILFL
jgi:hypothetical protein